MDLVPGGASTEVTSSNVHDYVRKYAEYRMCKAPEKALEVCTGVCLSLLNLLYRIWFQKLLHDM